MLLHVEAQLLRLAGEHLGELQEVEEEHELQVFAGQLLAFLRGAAGARGGLAGLVDRDPVVLQVRGLRDGGRGQAGLMRGGGVQQRLQMRFHLVIAAALKDAAALRQRFEQGGRVRAKRSDETGLDAFDLSGDLLAERVLRQLSRFAHAEAALIVGDTILHQGEGAGGGRDARGELATGIVRNHAVQMIGGEGEELGHADVRIVERILEERSKRSHGGGMSVRGVKAHTRVKKCIAPACHWLICVGFSALYEEVTGQVKTKRHSSDGIIYPKLRKLLPNTGRAGKSIFRQSQRLDRVKQRTEDDSHTANGRKKASGALQMSSVRAMA